MPPRRKASPLPAPPRRQPFVPPAERLTPWAGVLKSDKRAAGENEDDSGPPVPGDHVWVEEGEYKGCILTLLRVEEIPDLPRRFVCSRTTWPEEVRTKWISLYRRWPK